MERARACGVFSGALERAGNQAIGGAPSYCASSPFGLPEPPRTLICLSAPAETGPQER